MYVSTGLSYKFYHVLLTKLLCDSRARTGNPFIGKGSLKQKKKKKMKIFLRVHMIKPELGQLSVFQIHYITYFSSLLFSV